MKLVCVLGCVPGFAACVTHSHVLEEFMRLLLAKTFRACCDQAASWTAQPRFGEDLLVCMSDIQEAGSCALCRCRRAISGDFRHRCRSSPEGSSDGSPPSNEST